MTHEKIEKADAISHIMSPLRSSLSGAELAAPNTLRALLSEMSLEELNLLKAKPPLVKEIVRIMCLTTAKLGEELKGNFGLETEGWPSNQQSEVVDNFYLSTGHLEGVRPSWARDKTFSVGYYAETSAELGYVCRRLLTMRVRLALWQQLIAQRIEKAKNDLRARQGPPKGIGNYL